MASARKIALALIGALAALPAFADIKVGVNGHTIPTTTTTQDYTDTSIGSAFDCAVLLASRGITANVIHDDAAMSIGFVDDEANMANISNHDRDNVTTATTGRFETSVAHAIRFSDAATDSSQAEATASVITDGIQLSWSDIFNEEQVRALLLGGTDLECEVSSGALNGTTNVAINHGLSAAPHVIIAMSALNQNAATSSLNSSSIGFCDVSGTTCGTQRGMSRRTTDGAATSQTSNQWFNNALIVEHDNTADVYRMTVNTIGATTFNIVADQAAITDNVYFLSMRCTNCDIQVGDYTTKTSSGTQADITGMSQKPKLAFYLVNDMSGAAANTIDNSSAESESFGFGFAADNEGTTEYGAISMWTDDNVSMAGNNDSKSVISGSRGGFVFSGAGALSTVFSVDSWDSGGITHDYPVGETAATAYRVVYLAIAPLVASAPTFDAGIVETADTIDTLTFSYNASADADNIYCGLFRIGATPTEVEIEAGTGAHGTATEATTDPANSISITTDDADPQAAYAAKCVLENEIGYSAISTVAKAVMEPPAGMTYIEVSGYTQTAGEESVLDDASPAVVDGDWMQVTTTADCFIHGEDAHPVIWDDAGGFTINAGAGHAITLMIVERRVQDISVGAWSDAATVPYASNNQPPTFISLDTEAFPNGWLFAEDETQDVPLDGVWVHPYGRPLTHDAANLPTGITEDGENLDADPTTCGRYDTPELIAQDDLGLESEAIVPMVVAPRVPDLSGMTESEAEAAIAALCD